MFSPGLGERERRAEGLEPADEQQPLELVGRYIIGNLLKFTGRKCSLCAKQCSTLWCPAIHGFPVHGLNHSFGKTLDAVVNGVRMVAKLGTIL